MVYVVDDAADYRFLVQQVFKLFLPHYPIRLFADGLELIQHIDRHSGASMEEWERPKLILLDVDMPKLSGIQTLERLRQFPDWHAVPVVMISNRVDDSFVRASYERKACSFLLKPLDLERLKGMLTLLCQYWIDLNQLPSPDRRPTA